MHPTAPEHQPALRWCAVWEVGPDAGGAVVLGGRDEQQLIGRARSASIRCDDPALEPFHAVLAHVDQSLVLRQVAGLLPVCVDGAPVTGDVDISGGARVEIGDSVLVVRPVTAEQLTAPGRSGPVLASGGIVASTRGLTVVRGVRPAPVWSPQPIEPLAATTSGDAVGGALLPSLLALLGAGLLAVLLHQPMFLLFGAIGAVAAFGTWGGHRVGAARKRRAERRRERSDLDRFNAAVAMQRDQYVLHRRANDSTPATAHLAVTTPSLGLLWCRRASHADAFEVSVGTGALAWAPLLVSRPGVEAMPPGLEAMSVIADLSVPVDLGNASRLALQGQRHRTSAMMRSIAIQLAANCGPADLRIVAVLADVAEREWMERLPHVRTASGVSTVVDEAELVDVIAEFDATPDAHVVVFCDSAELLTTRTSSLRRVLGRERPPALVVTVLPEQPVPHVCTCVLHLHSATGARLHADVTDSSLPTSLHWAGMGLPAANRLARQLGALVDPEASAAGLSAVPRQASLWPLLPASVDPQRIVEAWSRGQADPAPRAVIGVAGDGVVDVDLVRDGPHALIAGTTGSGKSELLRSLIVGLALSCGPEHLVFVLIDYKGGATFDACADLPHVVGVVTDLDDRLADRALRSLRAELRRREQLLRQVGAGDLTSYRRVASHPLPRLVVVIDEFATLVAEQSEFLHALIGIAQRGRSLGVHLILATQRPSGVISDDIRANTNLRIALRLNDVGDALDVVGDPMPATIPRSLPGRAVMRLGPEEVLLFQTARCTGEPEALPQAVATVTAAAGLVGGEAPRGPWLPPLPDAVPVDVDALARGELGIVDHPDELRMDPLRWNPAGGHLALIGSPGSGLTSALCLLAAAATRAPWPSHLYIVDGRGSPLLDSIAEWPLCGGVVRLHERERLLRLLNTVVTAVTERAASSGGACQPVLLLIDGFESFRIALDDIDNGAAAAALERILANGAAHRIVVAATFHRAAAIPPSLASRCADRWVFHLTDPVEAAGCGVAAADVPGQTAGRVLLASSGLHAQLMVGGWTPGDGGSVEAPARIECLPSRVDAHALPLARSTASGLCLPLGLRFDDGEPSALDIPDGEHVLVLGPARSGRTSAIDLIVEAWRQVHPSGWWASVGPRRPMGSTPRHSRRRRLSDVLGRMPASGPVLLAVDDAELVDDDDAQLERLIGEHRPHCLIVAAGKPGSLRHSYGHWTGIIRRSRLGIVLSGASDVDADLLGVQLPRRAPLAPRPGLAWIVAGGAAVFTQLALPNAAGSESASGPAGWICGAQPVTGVARPAGL